MFKQVFGIAFSGYAYYLLIKINSYDVKELFRMYLNASLVISFLAVFQEVSYIFGLNWGYDYSWFLPKWKYCESAIHLLRVNAIMPEPAVLAIALTPAMFVALNELFKKRHLWLSRKSAFLILTAYLLSFSFLGMIGLLVSIVLILFQHQYFSIGTTKMIILILFFIPILGMTVFFVYWFVPEIFIRANDIFALISDVSKLSQVNLSVFAFFSNFFVTINAFTSNPLIGTGLGTYLQDYNAYIGRIMPSFSKKLLLNSNDANSLFLRMLAETGLIGVSLFLFFLFNCFIRKQAKIFDKDLEMYQMVNSGIFVLILLRLIRYGHYFTDGFFFFIFLYYFTAKAYKQKMKYLSENGY